MDPRFVVQEHTTSEGVHWDLMLEEGDALTTFRLGEGPENAAVRAVRAIRIFDHPLRFLTYEGPVQDGAGRVRIVERGNYRLLRQTDDLIALHLQGETLQGNFTLTRRADTAWGLSPMPLPGQR